MLVYNRPMSGNLAERVDAALRAGAVGSALVVGVSGGMDSVVLAHLLHGLAPQRGLQLHLAHFDHALRPASADDARFVAELAASWGLPLYTARWEHGGTFPGGMEAAARTARYAFLVDVARRVTPTGQAPTLIVAHHADDQAETLLLNLVRGSGLHGLVAMRMVAPWEDGAQPPVQILRPLLHTSRSELRAYAAAHALRWREDESNIDTARTRNFVRHQVMPLLTQRNPSIAATLARTAALLGLEADRLDALDDQLLVRATVAAAPETRLVLRYDTLAAVTWADRCALLRLGLRRTFAAREVGHAHIETLAAVVDAPAHASGPHPLVENIVWSVLHGEDGVLLSIHRAGALPITPEGPWIDDAWRAQHESLAIEPQAALAVAFGWRLEAVWVSHAIEEEARDDFDLWLPASLGRGLRLTTPRPGMRIAPLGMGGHTRTLGNIFTDRKVPTALRAGLPVVVDAAGRVLWLCGLAVAEGVLAQPGAPALYLRWVHNLPEATP